MDNEKKMILITDVGSTTTKGLLIGERDGGYVFLEQFDTPTTVEKPYEDVCVGFRAIIEELEKRTGQDFGYDGSSLRIPYLTTSSAGGGLQILVFGLSSVETGTIAEMTAYGAGGVVLKTFTVDDKISPVKKMRLMQELHPDMILMAGGIDGGAIAPIVELAEILSLAKPTPKFRVGDKIPLVFCGNTDAREFVFDLLEDNFEVRFTDNVRPDMERLNTEPAKREIHNLFMDNVMERAPGYSGLKKIVSSDILPTPAGVEAILLKYAAKRGGNIAMVDMGGATTDIFTVVKGKHSRTVAANIGMSYSLSNILADAGIESIASRIENLGNDEIRNYIVNKTLNPTYVPRYKNEINIEHSCAVEGIRIAWEMHRDMNFRSARVGFLDRRKKWLKNANKWEQVLYLHTKEEFFQLSDISLIIAAGGVFSHSSPKESLLIAADSFLPSGITEIAVDEDFKSPHMGVLSKTDSENALKLFEEECLRSIGWIIAPFGRIKPGKDALEVFDYATGETFSMKSGAIKILWSGGKFRFDCKSKLTFGTDGESFELETELPIIIDCRGRGDYFDGNNLAVFTGEKNGVPQFPLPTRTPEFGELKVVRKLPYSGDILVSPGDEVNPNDIVAENRFGPPRLYIIDLNKITGYESVQTPEEIAEGLLLKEGDTVKVGQTIFESHSGILGSMIRIKSPVRGRITKIEDSGLLILREIQDYDGRPRKVNIAKKLDIKPAHVPGYFKYKVGDFVEKDQLLVSDPKRMILIQSPTTGTIKKIDNTTGEVTIQYDVEPTPLYAFARGTVSEVKEEYSVTIDTKAVRLYGSVGFGGEASGNLAIVENQSDISEDIRGKIVACLSPVNGEFLRKCADYGASGAVIPSISNADWVDFHGKEMGVAVTGDEKLPFPIIITEGFGDYSMPESYRNILAESENKIAGLTGRTQIRAGVIRPALFIYD